MLYNKKFDYQPIQSTTDPNTSRRVYETPSGNLPSVTTILGDTGDKTAIYEWRDRIGHKKANEITKTSADFGTLMHKHLECYIQGLERPQGNNYIRKIARKGADIIIDRGLTNVDEVWGIEAPLYYPGLYAGTADVIGMYKGKPALMDFKNTRKPKKKEWISDYFMQLIAYSLAHDELYGTEIETGVIFMVSREEECFGEYQEFVIEGDEWHQYMEEWLQRVEKYYKS